jgi:hypothetical protein
MKGRYYEADEHREVDESWILPWPSLLLTMVAIRTALVEYPWESTLGKVPVSSGLVMIERGTQPDGDRRPEE